MPTLLGGCIRFLYTGFPNIKLDKMTQKDHLPALRPSNNVMTVPQIVPDSPLERSAYDVNTIYNNKKSRSNL